MSDPGIDHIVRRDAPVLRVTDSVETGVRTLLDSALPALPVVDDREELAGIFGEREFIEALFPGYLGQLRHTAFVPRSLDDMLERRQTCRDEPVAKHMNDERIHVSADSSDTQIAELFLHHRVLIIPVVAGRHVEGLVTRHDFFAAAASRLLTGP